MGHVSNVPVFAGTLETCPTFLPDAVKRRTSRWVRTGRGRGTFLCRALVYGDLSRCTQRGEACQAPQSVAFDWRRDGLAKVVRPTLLKRRVDAWAALHLLANRPDFCVAPKNGVTIGPWKRRSNLAGVADGRAGRRLSRKYAHCRLRVSPLWTPMLVMTSVAGPPKGSSVPSWQYTSRKAISSRVRIMVWSPVDLLAELRFAASIGSQESNARGMELATSLV